MQENVMYNNNNKKFQIKMVGTGSTNCQIQSSFTLYESPVQGLGKSGSEGLKRVEVLHTSSFYLICFM